MESAGLKCCCLVLLDGGLDQGQVLGHEALEATEDPDVGRGLLLVLVGALLDVGLQHGLVLLALTQLGHEVLHLEALDVVEQVELDEDALDVVAGDLIIGVVHRPVLGDQRLGHLAAGTALLAGVLQILGRAELVLGGGGLSGRDGRWDYLTGCSQPQLGALYSPDPAGRTAGWQWRSSY